MSNHAIVVAGGGPTGLMLAAELALWQNQIERVLAEWVAELAVPFYLGRTIGTGECAEVPEQALRAYGGATFEDLGTTDRNADYIWGDLVQIVTPAAPRFVNAEHQTAVVSAVSPDGANVCVFQQNSGGKRHVMYGFYEVSGMTSGVLHVYRPRVRPPTSLKR